VPAELWAGHGVDCVGAVRLLTRTGLDWTHKYPPIAGCDGGVARCAPSLSRRRVVRRLPRRHQSLRCNASADYDGSVWAKIV
jgi:hypothetical protein